MDQTEIKDLINPKDIRCFQCGKLLARNDSDDVGLKIKCNRCGSLNLVFKGVKDQVIITDADGVILYANGLVEEITGYSLIEVLGKKPSIWGGQMGDGFYRDLWQAIKVEKRPIQVIVTNKRKDGSLYKAWLHISPVFGVDRDVKMFVGIEKVIPDDL
jgi:PAS domain S-box-containing protein